MHSMLGSFILILQVTRPLSFLQHEDSSNLGGSSRSELAYLEEERVCILARIDELKTRLTELEQQLQESKQEVREDEESAVNLPD